MEYVFDIEDEIEGYSATCEKLAISIVTTSGNLNDLLDRIKDFIRNKEGELVSFKVIAFEHYDGFKIRIKTH